MKKFFEKYVNVAKIIKVWNYSITKEEVDKVFVELDLDKNKELQLKDLILKLIAKVIK